MRGQEIAKKIESALKDAGIKRKVAGSVIGEGIKSDQGKTKKLNSLLRRLYENNSDFDDIQKLADFFNRPVDFFLFGDDNSQHVGRDNNGTMQSGGGNMMIKNGDGGIVTVSHSDKEIVQKLLEIEDRDRDIIRSLIEQMAEKKKGK